MKERTPTTSTVHPWNLELMHKLIAVEQSVASRATAAADASEGARRVLLDAIAFHAELTAGGLMIACGDEDGLSPSSGTFSSSSLSLAEDLREAIALTRELARQSRSDGTALHRVCAVWLEHRLQLVSALGALGFDVGPLSAELDAHLVKSAAHPA